MGEFGGDGGEVVGGDETSGEGEAGFEGGEAAGEGEDADDAGAAFEAVGDAALFFEGAGFEGVERAGEIFDEHADEIAGVFLAEKFDEFGDGGVGRGHAGHDPIGLGGEAWRKPKAGGSFS